MPPLSHAAASGALARGIQVKVLKQTAFEAVLLLKDFLMLKAKVVICQSVD
jgi:hypothetical protein